MFLSEAELAELTGYIRPSKQIQWLKREGFSFRVSADGHPRVLQSHILQLMGGERKTSPNFSAMRG